MDALSIHHVTHEVRLPSSHLGPTLAEQHDQSQVSCSRREAEGTHAVFRHHVDAGPKLQQERGDFLVAEVALDTEHWGIVEDFCAIIHVGPGQHQQAAHLRAQTKGVLDRSLTLELQDAFPSPLLVL